MKSSVLIIHAAADKLQGDTWCASAAAPETVAGLFALGGSVHDARRNLAALIATLPIAEGADSIRIVCATRKTFDVNDLKATAS